MRGRVRHVLRSSIPHKDRRRKIMGKILDREIEQGVPEDEESILDMTDSFDPRNEDEWGEEEDEFQDPA